MGKSFSYTVHGIAASMSKSFKAFKVAEVAKPNCKNKALAKLIAAEYSNPAVIADKPRKLKIGVFSGSSGAEQMEKWITAPTKNVYAVDSSDSSICLASVYTFNSKWEKKLGESATPLKDKYRQFGVGHAKYHSNGAATVPMSDGSTLMFWYARATNGFDLWLKAYEVRAAIQANTKKRVYTNVEVYLPYVDLHQEGSYGLDGWKFGSGCYVDYAKYENWLELNSNGAKAKSVTRARIFKGIGPKREKPKKVVFDKPFAVAVFEKGCSYPTFVAKCDLDTWVKVAK